MEWKKKIFINNEELRKKIIDSYDSQLKDIFTEDEVLAILDALKPLVSTTPGFWPTLTTNAKGVIDANGIHLYDTDMLKFHPESENNTVISSNILNGD